MDYIYIIKREECFEDSLTGDVFEIHEWAYLNPMEANEACRELEIKRLQEGGNAGFETWHVKKLKVK